MVTVLFLIPVLQILNFLIGFVFDVFPGVMQTNIISPDMAQLHDLLIKSVYEQLKR